MAEEAAALTQRPEQQAVMVLFQVVVVVAVQLVLTEITAALAVPVATAG
jgi:hypothetical protein